MLENIGLLLAYIIAFIVIVAVVYKAAKIVLASIIALNEENKKTNA